jgi:hypothetical protein
MISIRHWPNFGFGNRLLYYNNLRQLAQVNNEPWACVRWDGCHHFDGDMLNSIDSESQNFPPCLGEKFFQVDSLSTRDIFKLKSKPDVPPNTCAVHFRGTDFHHWNPKSILNVDYYLKSIDMVKDGVSQFILFTDDVNLNSFNVIKSKLDGEGISFNCGDNTSNRSSFISDFSLMSECDYIISSPSTFCICAGFVGKDKKIIHSADWISDRVDKDDKFWVDLNNGGNYNYKLWKMF